ncbi:MAG: hypothetical protein ACLGHM_02105 [Actinomycetes bacterium]
MIAMVVSLFRALGREHRATLHATRQELVDHVADQVGDQYGLELPDAAPARPRRRWPWRGNDAGAGSGEQAHPGSPQEGEGPGREGLQSEDQRG